MNKEQSLWWCQAKSDYTVYLHLRKSGIHECHLLHYLQMASEKIGKAYFWRTGKIPPKNHSGFYEFLKALLDRRPSEELERIARCLGYARTSDLEQWIKQILNLARDLENMAPAKARNSANPEYPWPHDSPLYCPAEYNFPLWKQLNDTGRGRKLINFIDRCIQQFDMIA